MKTAVPHLAPPPAARGRENELEFKLKNLKVKSVFDFRKLIKIFRNGLKIQEFAWW
jgi:hypothetical protein